MEEISFGNSKMDLLYYDDTSADEKIDCKVTIQHQQIRLSYEWGGEFITYLGTEVEPGHFELQSSAVNGRGTLHRRTNSKFLDGFWVEGGIRGMWRVTLA